MKIRTYGCSFTNYLLGTYADILGCDHEVTNCGRSGCGNDFIKYQVLNDYNQGILDTYDLVIIQWSGFTRWNYKTANNKWIGLDGSIFNKSNKESKRALNHVRSFYNPLYEQEKFLHDMTLVKGLLDNKKIDNFVLSYEPSNLEFVYIDNIAKAYKGDYIFDKGADWIKKPFIDEHPNLAAHLDIAKKIAPISERTIKITETVHKEIRASNNFVDYRSNFTYRKTTTSS